MANALLSDSPSLPVDLWDLGGTASHAASWFTRGECAQFPAPTCLPPEVCARRRPPLRIAIPQQKRLQKINHLCCAVCGKCGKRVPVGRAAVYYFIVCISEEGGREGGGGAGCFYTSETCNHSFLIHLGHIISHISLALIPSCVVVHSFLLAPNIWQKLWLLH